MSEPHPYWVTCRDCRRVWSICELPLEVEAVIKALEANSPCPVCGGTVMTARQDGGMLLEPIERTQP